MTTAAEFIKSMTRVFKPEAAAGVNCVIQYACDTPVYMTIKDGACKVDDGSSPTAPTVTIIMKDADLIDLFTGKLNGLTAYTTGKIKIDGDMGLAQRMGSFFDPSKARSQRPSDGGMSPW